MLKRHSYKPFINVLLGLVIVSAGWSGIAPLHAQSAPGKKVADEAKPAAPAGIAATVQWLRRIELSAPLTGTVTEVLAEAGDAVQKGQILLRLDARAYLALANKAQAELNRLRIAHTEAQRELRRMETLHRRNLVSAHELQLARIAAAGAEADFGAAQAVDAQAQLDLERCTLRAPFDGVVVQRQAEPGQMLVSGTKPATLMVVAETGRLRARAEVQRDVLTNIKRGQQVTVSVADKDYAGTVKFVGMEPLDGLGGQFAQYELVVEFTPAPDAGLYAGQPAQLKLP